MATLAKLYGQYRKRLSVKGFMWVVGQPYWRLRDYLQGGARRERQVQVQSRAVTALLRVAGAQPTDGYRRVYHRPCQQHTWIGRERVRCLMGELGLRPPLPIKHKRPTHPVVAEADGPPGRRLQIDATRFRLDDGVAWIYRVEDVKTRQCVAASAAPSLSQARAADTLWRAIGADPPWGCQGYIWSRVMPVRILPPVTFSRSARLSGRGCAAAWPGSVAWASWSA